MFAWLLLSLWVIVWAARLWIADLRGQGQRQGRSWQDCAPECTCWPGGYACSSIGLPCSEQESTR